MKKLFLILSGGLILILVLLVWAYLFIFGTPQSTDDIFTDLGFTPNTSRPVTIVEPTPTETPRVDISGEPLRQLTIRPIAGYIAYGTSSERYVRYAERGTGHIYEINLTTGEEIRRSGTTIPRTSEAVFSESGDIVALSSITGYTRDVVAGKITTSETDGKILEITNLPTGADEIDIIGTNIFFLLSSPGGSNGYRFNIDTQTQTELFSTPFSAVRVVWGEPNIMYNRTDPDFESGVYNASETPLTPLLPAAYGQMVIPTSEYIIRTYRAPNKLVSEAVGDSSITPLAILAIPEKCSSASSTANTLWCAAELGEPDPLYIKNWYIGSESPSDFLWEINLTTGAATLVSNLFEQSGRQIDVTNLKKFDTQLFFQNKLDDTLWLYDLSII